MSIGIFISKSLTNLSFCDNIFIEKRYTDDGCSLAQLKDNRTFGTWAVIFFFYFRFIRSEIITITIATANIASVVIISNFQVQTKDHKHHSFRTDCERSKKDMSPFAKKTKGATATVYGVPLVKEVCTSVTTIIISQK